MNWSTNPLSIPNAVNQPDLTACILSLEKKKNFKNLISLMLLFNAFTVNAFYVLINEGKS